MFEENSARRNNLLSIIQAFPSENPGEDFEFLVSYSNEFHDFNNSFIGLKKLDMYTMTNEKQLLLLSSLLSCCSTASQLRELYNYFLQFLTLQDMMPTLIETELLPDLFIPVIAKDSSLLPIILPIISNIFPTPSRIRFLRESMFRFSAIRKETENCLSIIFSMRPIMSSADFFEFSTYSASLAPLLVQSPKFAQQMFDYVLNLASLMAGTQRKWLVNYAASISSLLSSHSSHQAGHSFVNFTAKHEEAKVFSASLFYDNQQIKDSKPAIRPHYLYQKWNVDLYKLDKYQPYEIYNAILTMIKNKDSRLLDFLDTLPIEASLPFYFLNIQNNEKAFHAAVSKAFETKHQKIALSILEKCARTNPALVKPHFNEISLCGITANPELISLLIKSEQLDFVRLWPTVKKHSIDQMKPIVRQGILQIQRRAHTKENHAFIYNVLKHYFSDMHDGINWSPVASTFPDDIDIASTILLNSAPTEDSNNQELKPLLEWRQGFKEFVRYAPSNIQSLLIIPILFIFTGDTSLPLGHIKWAISRIPASSCPTVSIIESFALFEMLKHIVSLNSSISQVYPGFQVDSANSYQGVIAHAAIASASQSMNSYNLVVKGLSSVSKNLRDTSRYCLEFLRLTNFQLPEGKKFLHSRVPLVEKVLSLLTNTTRSLKVIDVPLTPEDQEYIDLLQSTHSITSSEINQLISKKDFNDLKELRMHFLKLGLACYRILPAHFVPTNSIEACIRMATSPAATTDDIKFALYAMSQTPGVTEFEAGMANLGNEKLHRAACCLAIRQNDSAVIQHFLKHSDDIGLLRIMKPFLPVLDQDQIVEFIKRAAPKTDTATLLDSVDLFANAKPLIALFEEIRKRKTREILSRNTDKLKSALMKLKPEQIDEHVLKPFDDFALIAAMECGLSLGTIIWNIASSKVVTFEALFAYGMTKHQRVSEIVDGLYTVLENLTIQEEIQRIIICIALFTLIQSPKEPFVSIRKHFEVCPDDIKDETLIYLLPSLVSLGSTISPRQTIILYEKSFGEYDNVKDEVKECMRLHSIQ